jgi:predicted outer membrane repeat protein
MLRYHIEPECRTCIRILAGAILATGNSTIKVFDSVLESNYVKDYDAKGKGGACLVNETATLVLSNTLFRNNRADYGGAIAMESTT